MKSFKEVINEGGEMYPADDMTMQEVKIACYAAQNILDRLEKGAMIQRWQISAIVKAKEELASVYTSMSTDEEGDDEWEDDDYGDEEEQVYVGYEYPGMYGESVGGLFKNASEWESAAKSRGLVVKSMTHPSGETTKYQIAKDKQGNNRGHFDHGTKSGHLKEEAVTKESFGRSAGSWSDEMNKASKKAKADAEEKIKKLGPVTSDTLKDINDKLGNNKKNVKEEADFKVSVEGLPKMFVKAKSENDAKSKLRKVVKNPDMIKDVERVTSSDVKKTFRDFLSGKKAVEEETDLEEADGTKRNRELLATGRISKDEFDKRMGYGKYKKTDNSKKLDGPGGIYKNLVKRLGEESLEESPAEMKKAALDVKKVYNGGGKPPHYVVVRGATGLKAFDNEADARAHRDHLKRQEEMKEELDEAVTVNKKNYSWGKMVTIHHGSSHSYPLHPEHQEKIKNLKDGESTSFKDETGTHVTAHREGDKIHLGQKKVNAKTTVARSHFTEEVNLDEVSTSTLRSYIDKAKEDKNKQKKAATVAKNDMKKYGMSSDRDRADAAKRKASNRNTGMSVAKKKLGMYPKDLAQPKVMATEETNLDENYIVHVDDGSKYGDTPHKKDVEHVMAGAKTHGGEFDGVSDKGAFYKFKNRNSASNFVNHVRKSPHKTVDATLDESANLDEAESWEAGYKRRVVKTTKPEHKEKGYNWRIKGKERPEISIKLYKEKPSQEEFNKQMKRVAGHEFGG